MAYGYVPVDRDQLFLLPPNMADWLPKDHLAWFVIDVVNRVDTSRLHRKHPNDGVGRRAYNPDMMLALLIYSYCSAQRSSRQIERLCSSDVAFRVISADCQPDHATICKFRRDLGDFAKELFIEVLALAKEVGMTTVGIVALDGTKMKADASLKRNRTKTQLEALVSEMFDEAEAIDAVEDEKYGDKRGDELPAEMADPQTRKAAIDKALEALRDRENTEPTKVQERNRDHRVESSRRREFRSLQRLRREKHKARQARHRNEERIANGLKPIGVSRKASNEIEPGYVRRARLDYEANKARRIKFEKRTGAELKPDTRINLTDPDSSVMQAANGAWVQAYNAQAAVNEHGIVVGSLLGNNPTDVNQFVPMIKDIETNFDRANINCPLGTVIADAGYLSTDNLEAAGPDRLIANGKAWKMNSQPETSQPLATDANPLEINAHRLLTKEGRELYGKRQHMIEPRFGHIKHNKSMRHLMQRGISFATAEWNLILTVLNIETLYLRAQ